MATFPRSEAQIVALAQQMQAGLAAHAEVFADPPVPVVDLGGLRSGYVAVRAQATQAQAAAEAAIASKEEALGRLADAMKRDLRYAENTVGADNDEQLQFVLAMNKAGESEASNTVMAVL